MCPNWGELMPKAAHKYIDLADYCDRNSHLLEKYIAETVLEIDQARFSKLKSRKYGLKPNGDETARIAELLNRSESYVRSYYEGVA